MLSTMTVTLDKIEQSISPNGKVVMTGTAIFHTYNKGEVVSQSRRFEANGAAVLPIINSNKTGVAVGFIDFINKLPVLKIQHFIATNSIHQVVPASNKEVADASSESIFHRAATPVF